jgi:uncharacterized integral membrane protein
MRFRTLLVIAAASMTCAFFIINWQVFSAPTKFSLVFTSFEAPVGLVMVGVFAIIVLTLTIYMGIGQRTLLMEYRRQAKELQSQRTLADNAEASRFTEMGALMHTEMANLRAWLEASLGSVREEFRNTENSIAATLGEMDDRLQRSTRGLPSHDAS